MAGSSGSESKGQGQSSSSGQGTSQSGSYIPEYEESPILRAIAQYAFEQAPQVYQWGMEQFNKNQGNIDSLLRDALQYASPQRIAVDMGMAEAGVEQGAEAGRLNAIRDLESFGIDPSSGRYAQLDQANRVMAGASAAGAGNQQRMADQAAGNAMRNQAISAALQNTQLGYEAAKAMQSLLNTGMSLKYPPLGNQASSQNTSQSQSTNTSTSTSKSVQTDPSKSGGGEGGEQGQPKEQQQPKQQQPKQQGGQQGGQGDTRGRDQPSIIPPEQQQPVQQQPVQQPVEPQPVSGDQGPENPWPGDQGPENPWQGDQGPNPAESGWTWDPVTQTWMPPDTEPSTRPTEGDLAETGQIFTRDPETGDLVSNIPLQEGAQQAGWTWDPATGTWVPPRGEDTEETAPATETGPTDLPPTTEDTPPAAEAGTETGAETQVAAEGDLSGLGQADPNVLAEAQNTDPNTGLPYDFGEQEGEQYDPNWANQQAEDWDTIDQQNQDWEGQQEQDWQDQYDQENQDWQDQQDQESQDWESQQEQDWQDQQDQYDQENQDWENQQNQDWQDQQDQYDQENQDWQDQQNNYDTGGGGEDYGDYGGESEYGYQRGGQVRRRPMPMPMRTGYRPMTPPRPVQNVQNSPMIATPGQRPPPPVPPRLGSIAGQPQYPRPLPNGMQRGGRVRPMRAPAAQPTTGGFVSRELSPSRGQQTDDVQARLNAGEFVIPKDVAHWKGKEFFHKLIQQARKARGAGPNGQPNGQMRTGYGAQR